MYERRSAVSQTRRYWLVRMAGLALEMKTTMTRAAAFCCLLIWTLLHKGLGVAASGAWGGTIWTWRLSGEFDIEGGGRM
jgi:hypothetical protein